MNDLSRIVNEMCAWFDGADAAPVPTVPTSAERRGNAQAIDTIRISHTSRSSHTESKASQKIEHAGSGNVKNPAGGSRVASSYVGDVGSVGNVGSGAETLAESTFLPFPQDFEEVGSVERADSFCEHPSSDQSRTAPPPGDPLPISADAVCAGVARELRVLAEDGREGPDALRDAVEITRAKIRNSEALAEGQAHAGQCHVCSGPLDDAAPVVAVLSWSRGKALHMHAECHNAYRPRRAALVDRIMAAAGYGAEADGEAA